MKQSAVILSVLIIFISVITGVLFFRTSDLSDAIDQFDDQDYIESLKILNQLSKTADYEKGEKILYYKCRAINRLAAATEKDFKKELSSIALKKKNDPEYMQIKSEVETEISQINREINGDLQIEPGRDKSRILSRGRIYDEFISKYRGSAYIEDLDYEELQKKIITSPEALVNGIIYFTNKYPNTDYISAIVDMLFEFIRKGDVNFPSKNESLIKIISTYSMRYPTSPLLNRIHISQNQNVNLRNSPSIRGEIVNKTDKDELLIQTDKSMDTSQIGDSRDYWYRVTGLDGKKGWIFGKFLAPYKTSKRVSEKNNDIWSIDENFSSWKDSHTPLNWTHIKKADPSCVSFSSRGNINTVSLNCGKGKTSGLFSRHSSTRAFKIAVRARFAGGSSTTLLSYVSGKDRTFNIKLLEEKISICGRQVPIHTSDWHEYILESENGKFAKLLIDGEIISGRIAPVKNGDHKIRGIYCFYSSAEDISMAEMQYIRIR